MIFQVPSLEGTAKNNSLKELGKAAGKTGTAENTEKEHPHAWFCGYFPYDNPKYAMTVFIENGGYGSGPALKVFDSIAFETLYMENK
ncbi:penicillin-binding transpeptidase domain-containing protein [Anaerofustis sp.]|uniref:penicillin-binding transpeptidase domain-containing protein n=1 Tax=Anaerofustis sp. TaxID=1872517 RepID=UPI0025B9981E|nr:penicillin-binding transpeptidase domain-containing protein [Anaerofustis sp.]